MGILQIKYNLKNIKILKFQEFLQNCIEQIVCFINGFYYRKK